MSWQPSASLISLQARANLLRKIRDFFHQREILEVETPLLMRATIPDPNIHSIKTTNNFYLQTSPEFAMKRLLAANSGPIFQISKAFRDAEAGHKHNPEFTLLEWYRPGFTHLDLMQEVNDLLNHILNSQAASFKTYADIFIEHLEINPHTASLEKLKAVAAKYQLDNIQGMQNASHDAWLDLLLSHLIEPKLGVDAPLFVYDYPATQAALAKIRNDAGIKVAERFEVYIQGIELANGFHELAAADEQRQRFLADLQKRRQLNLACPPLDEHLLAALANGFPDCAGVALGVDRLLMLLTAQKSIKNVLSFDINKC